MRKAYFSKMRPALCNLFLMNFPPRNFECSSVFDNFLPLQSLTTGTCSIVGKGNPRIVCTCRFRL